MGEPYNLFTGQSLERLTALSDGVFAVAMTLLVLDVRVPASTGLALSEHGLWSALVKLGPSFAAYLLSFTMLGTFWLAQHTLLGILGRCDRTLTWINLGFLFVVSLLPFSAALLAHYVDLRLAVGVYWLNIFLLGAGLEWSARYGGSAFLPQSLPTQQTRGAGASPRMANCSPPDAISVPSTSAYVSSVRPTAVPMTLMRPSSSTRMLSGSVAAATCPVNVSRSSVVSPVRRASPQHS
jgi:uncharacterized membrane protein